MNEKKWSVLISKNEIKNIDHLFAPSKEQVSIYISRSNLFKKKQNY